MHTAPLRGACLRHFLVCVVSATVLIPAPPCLPLSLPATGHTLVVTDRWPGLMHSQAHWWAHRGHHANTSFILESKVCQNASG